MSILSNSNYQQTVQAITRLKQMLHQQSVQEMQKYEVIAIKTKIIEEQILQAQLALDKHEADCSRKIDQFAGDVRVKLKDLKENSNEKEIEGDLSKQLKELQNCRDKLCKMLKNQNQTTAEKIDREINSIQQSFEYKVKVEREAFANKEKALKEEVSKLRQKLSKNEYGRRSEQLIGVLEQMKMNIDKQMGDLRSKRKQKKQKFLQLLEAIIVKCKETHQSKK